MQTQESAQHQNEELTKIGKSWFKPSICPLLQQDQSLQSYIENIDSFQPLVLHYYIKGRLASCPIKTMELLKHMEKTQIENSYGISPNCLAHINFKNLKCLNIYGSSISNIESIQLMDLSHLTHLELNQNILSHRKQMTQIKSIKPLVKTTMPSLKQLKLCGFSLEHLYRELPRVKTPKQVRQIHLAIQRSTQKYLKSDPIDQLQLSYRGLCLKYEPIKTNHFYFGHCHHFENL